MADYLFTKASCDAAQLHQEVEADPGISPACTKIDYAGSGTDELCVSFASGLSGGEQTTLSGLVSAHAPITRGPRTEVDDAAYQMVPHDRIVAVIAITASRIITLPDPAYCSAGLVVVVKDESGDCSGSETITVNQNSSETVDGSSSVVINTAYGSASLYTNGTDWFLVAVI